MTALGKRKENNEIKPLPPDLGWDVTACLFSPAPVFSQLSNLLCSCGSMIQREEKKKKEEGAGEEKAAAFLCQPLPPLAAGTWCVCSVQNETESKGTCFWRGKKTLPTPPGQVNERQLQG